MKKEKYVFISLSAVLVAIILYLLFFQNTITINEAYEKAVDNGFTGTKQEWVDSLQGVDGTDGIDGKDGYTPIKGVDYFDGVDGIDGTDGIDGKDGYTPIKGVDYFDGVDGIDGTNGIDGINGVDGYTPVKDVDYFDGIDGINGVDGYTPIKDVDYFDGIDGTNGTNGIDGINGVDGYTPVKGVDYFDGIDGADAVAGKLPSAYVELEASVGVTSATLIDVPEMSTTIVIDEPVEISVIASFEAQTQSGSSASTLGISINIDGVDYDTYERYLSGNNDKGIGSIVHRTGELAPGTHTIKLRYQRTVGTSTPGLNHADMLVMAMQGAKGADGADGAPGLNSITGTTETTIEGLIKGVSGFAAQAISGVDYLTPADVSTTYFKLDGSNGPIVGNVIIQPTVDSATALQVKDALGNEIFSVNTIDKTFTMGPTSVFNFLGSTMFGTEATGYTSFEADGTLKMNGTATVWDDLRVAVAVRPNGSQAPSFTSGFAGDANLYAYYFEAASNDNIYFELQMPHSWAGTTIYPHIHYSPTTTGTGTVVWKMTCTWADINGTFGTPFNYDMSDTISTAGQWKHIIAKGVGGVTPTVDQDGISAMLQCRLYRDAVNVLDTYTGNAAMLAFDIHYEQDTLGSREEYSK